MVDASLRFDDEAARPLPMDSLATGTYRPTDGDDLSEDVYPAPAPANEANTSLSVFDGTDPNGTWSLYAFDDAGNANSLIQGWSLHVEWDDRAAPSGTVTIAGGAAASPTTSVALSVNATDPAPASGVTQMRFSNDGATWSPYRPYATTTAWDLPSGDGEKTVFAQFADSAGNVSAIAQDKIVLDTVGPRATKVVPAKGAKDVAPTRKIKITATEALDAKSLTAHNVVLTRNFKRVEVHLVYKPGQHKIVLEPTSPLKPGDYRLKVRTRVRDLVGNRWDAKSKSGLQPTVSRFTV